MEYQCIVNRFTVVSSCAQLCPVVPSCFQLFPVVSSCFQLFPVVSNVSYIDDINEYICTTRIV